MAVAAQGQVEHTGRIETSKDSLELFAASLAPDDQVVLEATGPAFAIARILGPYGGRVVVANAQEVRAISHARVKSDRFDAATLARLLSADLLPEVWVCDERIGALRRRLGRRGSLVRQRTRAKNEVHAVLSLPARAPAGERSVRQSRPRLARRPRPRGGRAGDRRRLPAPDRLPRLGDRADRREGRAVRARLAGLPPADDDPRRRCDHRRCARRGDRRHRALLLAAQTGRLPRTRSQGPPVGAGASAPRRISKRGDARARFVLVEAAWTATRTPGPLRAFGERIRVRRGSQIAAVAVARKIATIAWQMLSKGEDYAFARPSLTRQKLRRLERLARAEPDTLVDKRPQRRVVDQERELQRQAERSYRRLVSDWQASKKGAGATPGRASQRPSKGKAARQTSKPQAPAL